MKKSLVVVESPAKARTLNRFLGKDYTVMASVGHIKDLPKSKLGVDIEDDFRPHYTTIKGKAKTIKELKKASKSAGEIFLAPDPDREGEAIAWHIAEEVAAKDGKKVLRVLFNEITEKAVKEAIKHPTTLDRDKYEAQQARRVLDRLVGYQVSPILWEKVRRGLSAGRVQSVAVRLICEREKQIKKFVPKEYWSITAEFEGRGDEAGFKAKIVKKDNKKLEIRSEAEAKKILDELKGAGFVVDRIEKKERKKNPMPPFITSKLQQEASRNFTAKKTMAMAQQLYEGIEIGQEGLVGLITYMRTDSTRLSSEAVGAVRAFIKHNYGDDYLPSKPVVYRSKKGAQEAHEAIEAVKSYLTGDQWRLYHIIWNRFIACQMKPAILDQTRVDIGAGRYIFRANGTVVKFSGFTIIYEEGKDIEEEKEGQLPALKKGEDLTVKTLLPQQHFTQPPARFTEATLVKELEENGIGRPSTYAAILSTIQEREYVVKEKNLLNPTELGLLITDLLVKSFPKILDVAFTAHMEEELDMIEEGKLPWLGVMKEFYGPFKEDLERAKSEMKSVKTEETPTDIVCKTCGRMMVIKWGRKGKFLACTGEG
jgi:DNA topoisomerase-1